MNTFKLGSIEVGRNHPPVFLPDIDLFFNRDLCVAKKLIQDLLAAGVKIIKSAIIHDISIAYDDDTEQKYMTADGLKAENYRQIIQRKVMSLKEYEDLFNLIKSTGVDLIVSVYDVVGAKFAKDFDACAIKIPTSNITHEYLIQFVASMGLPVILDTGKSTLEEIARAVQWIKDTSNVNLIIEHSPLAPPSPLSEHHLLMMRQLGELFNCPYGLSDHHRSEEMLYAATALGANLLEKGVIPDDQTDDIDVYHAMKVSQVKEVITKCNNIYTALGSNLRHIHRDTAKPIDRMGLVATRDLTAKDIISCETIHFAFPARGIPSEKWSFVQGANVRANVKRGEAIQWEDIDLVKS